MNYIPGEDFKREKEKEEQKETRENLQRLTIASASRLAIELAVSSPATVLHQPNLQIKSLPRRIFLENQTFHKDAQINFAAPDPDCFCVVVVVVVVVVVLPGCLVCVCPVTDWR